MIINMYWSSCEVPDIIVRFLKKLVIYGQILEKCRNIKFHENLSSGSRVFTADGRTDTHESNRRFSQFFESREDSKSKNSAAIPYTTLIIRGQSTFCQVLPDQIYQN